MILKLILQAIMPKKQVYRQFHDQKISMTYHKIKRIFLDYCNEGILCINGDWYRNRGDKTPFQKIWNKNFPDQDFMLYVLKFAGLSGELCSIPTEKLDDVFDAARNPTSPESLQLLEEELLSLKKQKEQKEQERREALERKEQHRLKAWDALSDANKALLIAWSKKP